MNSCGVRTPRKNGTGILIVTEDAADAVGSRQTKTDRSQRRRGDR